MFLFDEKTNRNALISTTQVGIFYQVTPEESLIFSVMLHFHFAYQVSACPGLGCQGVFVSHLKHRGNVLIL